MNTVEYVIRARFVEPPEKTTIPDDMRIGDAMFDLFGEIVEGGKVLASGLDITKDALRDLVGDMKDVERQAEKTADGIRDISEAVAGGIDGRGGGNRAKGRASGGPVWPGTWLVGERGPELLTLGGGAFGHVINASDTSRLLGTGGSGSGGVDEDRLARLIARELAAALPKRGDVNVYGAGTEEVTARVLRYLRQQDTLLSGRGPR